VRDRSRLLSPISSSIDFLQWSLDWNASLQDGMENTDAAGTFSSQRDPQERLHPKTASQLKSYFNSFFQNQNASSTMQTISHMNIELRKDLRRPALNSMEQQLAETPSSRLIENGRVSSDTRKQIMQSCVDLATILVSDNLTADDSPNSFQDDMAPMELSVLSTIQAEDHGLATDLDILPDNATHATLEAAAVASLQKMRVPN